MASGIARGRVRTTTTEFRNTAVIFQIIGWQDMQPWFTVYFFDIENPFYDQLHLSKQGTRPSDHIAGSSLQLCNCWFSIGLRAHAMLTC